jgi:hypothetical protein
MAIQLGSGIYGPFSESDLQPRYFEWDANAGRMVECAPDLDPLAIRVDSLFRPAAARHTAPARLTSLVAGDVTQSTRSAADFPAYWAEGTALPWNTESYRLVDERGEFIEVVRPGAIATEGGPVPITNGHGGADRIGIAFLHSTPTALGFTGRTECDPALLAQLRENQCFAVSVCYREVLEERWSRTAQGSRLRVIQRASLDHLAAVRAGAFPNTSLHIGPQLR